jgi:subtilisin family serine protease
VGGSNDDCHGHGTHVAGTVGSATYGVAKGVTLIGVRVFGCGSSGSNSTIVAGINWVAANAVKPAVANMSLGGPASSTTDAAVNGLISAGVVAVVAAGNDGLNACNYSPARVANAITVGSTTSTDARSSFSNYGTCVDVFAPGSSILSTWIGSTSATNTINGTSMASPHVAGVAALYLQGNTTATPATVANAITTTATLNKVTSAGTGSPNRLLFSLLTGGTTPPGNTFTYTGSLSGTGAAAIQPGGTYYQSTVSGAHTAALTGTGADFDLFLFKWNGSSWSQVASSEGATSTENINYSGTAGYYYWRIYSYSGSGSYTLVTTRP